MPARVIPALLVALLIPIPAYAQDVNSQLIEAAKNGETEKVKALLDEGAEVDATDINGMTALMWAAFGGSAKTVKVLLDTGADVSVKDKQGSTAQTWAAGTEIRQLLQQTERVKTLLDAGFELIYEGKFREALDALVRAAETDQNNAKIYTTLGLLYQKIGECQLAWKYLRIAEELSYRSSELEREVESLCKEPREKAREEILKLSDFSLQIQFDPEQQQWPHRAKLPIIQPSVRWPYFELTLEQIRKIRKLSGRVVPWIIIGEESDVVAIDSGDGWITLVLVRSSFPFLR